MRKLYHFRAFLFFFLSFLKARVLFQLSRQIYTCNSCFNGAVRAQQPQLFAVVEERLLGRGINSARSLAQRSPSFPANDVRAAQRVHFPGQRAPTAAAETSFAGAGGRRRAVCFCVVPSYPRGDYPGRARVRTCVGGVAEPTTVVSFTELPRLWLARSRSECAARFLEDKKKNPFARLG